MPEHQRFCPFPNHERLSCPLGAVSLSEREKGESKGDDGRVSQLLLAKAAQIHSPFNRHGAIFRRRAGRDEGVRRRQ